MSLLPDPDLSLPVSFHCNSYNGQEMAKALGSAGIDTTVVSDSAVFAVMSRVNKVILGAHAGTCQKEGFVVTNVELLFTNIVLVTANGGLVAVGGTYNVTAAAKYHATPVVVCSGLYKVCPSYPYDTDIYNLCISPDSVFEFENGESAWGLRMYVAPVRPNS